MHEIYDKLMQNLKSANKNSKVATVKIQQTTSATHTISY